MYDGPFGQPLDSKELVQTRIEERQPAMVENFADSYIIDDPENTYYSEEELEASAPLEKQLEAEAATAQVSKSDVATAAAQAAKASSPEKKEPNKKLIYGGLAAIAAIWYMNQD